MTEGELDITTVLKEINETLQSIRKLLFKALLEQRLLNE